MGKFFSALHIKSSSKDQFVKMFTQLMKKDGYVPCSEDEAALSYAAAFSEGGWVTLSNGDDSVSELTKLSAKIARDMKTSCFTVEAVDSDFAILELHAPSGRTSRIVVGDGEGYGVEKAPFSADDWKPLLQNGDIEQFLAVIGQNSTFVEDDLAEIGGLLGISRFAMTADYDEFSENKGAFELSFKKAAEKKLTLNAAFVKVFGATLEPFGFKKIKGQQPYFVRCVSDAIIHIVSIARKPHERVIGGKTFDILCGVATIYRGEIDFSIKPEDSWLQSVSEIYSKSHNCDLDMEYRASIMGFDYDTQIPHIFKNYDVGFTTDESEMTDSLRKALDATTQVALPIIDEVTDLMSCEKYFNTVMQPEYLSLDYKGEGLFLLKLFSSAEELYQFKESEALRELKEREFICNKAGGDFSAEIKIFDERREERRKYWFDMFNDPKLQSKFPEELERRRKENTEKLKGYGLNI